MTPTAIQPSESTSLTIGNASPTSRKTSAVRR